MVNPHIRRKDQNMDNNKFNQLTEIVAQMAISSQSTTSELGARMETLATAVATLVETQAANRSTGSSFKGVTSRPDKYIDAQHFSVENYMMTTFSSWCNMNGLQNKSEAFHRFIHLSFPSSKHQAIQNILNRPGSTETEKLALIQKRIVAIPANQLRNRFQTLEMKKGDSFLIFIERLTNVSLAAYPELAEQDRLTAIKDRFIEAYARTRTESMSIYIMITNAEWDALSYDQLVEKILTIENHFSISIQEPKKTPVTQDNNMTGISAIGEKNKDSVQAVSTKGKKVKKVANKFTARPRVSDEEFKKGRRECEMSACKHGYNIHWQNATFCQKCGHKHSADKPGVQVIQETQSENKVSVDNMCMLHDDIINVDESHHIEKPHELSAKIGTNKKFVHSLYDSGAGRSYMQHSYYLHLKNKRLIPEQEIEPDTLGANQADGTTAFETIGIVRNLRTTLIDSSGKESVFELDFVLASKMSYSVLLGRSLMRKTGAILTEPDGRIFLNPEVEDVLIDPGNNIQVETQSMSKDQVRSIADELCQRDSMTIGHKDEVGDKIPLKNGESLTVSANRSQDFKFRIKKLFDEYIDVVGQTVTQNKLHVAKLEFTSRPKDAAPYNPSSPTMVKILESKIEKLLRDKACVKTGATANCNSFLVSKNNGLPGEAGYRLVHDLSNYNKHTKKFTYRTPSAKEIFARIGKSVVYSTTDLMDAFHSCPISVECPGEFPIMNLPGLEYNIKMLTLPQGLVSASGHFSHSTEIVWPRRNHQGFLQRYLDDLMIHSDSESDHINHWREILKGFRSSGLSLNLQKTKVGFQEIEFLNFSIRGSTIYPGKAHLSAIANLNDEKKVETIIGFITYFADFLNFAGGSKLLLDLRKNAHEGWTDEKRKMLCEIKKRLLNASRITIPDFEHTIHIFSDASNSGYGFIMLLHPDKNNTKSFTELTKSELTLLPAMMYAKDMRNEKSWINKSTYERESIGAAACMKKAEYFLSGTHPVYFYIDNQALSAALKSRSMKLRNMFSLLADNIKIKHVSSGTNLADILSRFVNGNEPKTTAGKDTFFAIETRKNSGSKTNEEKKLEILQSNVKFHRRGGHACAERLYALNKALYAPEVMPTRQEIEQEIQLQCGCNSLLAGGKTKHSSPVPPSTHSLIFLDYKILGSNIILSIFEPLSRSYFPIVVKNEQSGPLIEAIRNFLTVFGHVSTIKADNGASFTSQEFKNFCGNLDISLKYTAIFNPKANLSERSHRSLNKHLDVMRQQGTKLTKNDLVTFAWSHNLLPKRSTGHAPSEILYGGFPEGIIDDVMTKHSTTEKNNSIAGEVVEKLTKKAFLGMLDSKGQEPEPIPNGTPLRWSVSTNAGKIIRNGHCIAANRSSVLIKFENQNCPRWVSRSKITKSIEKKDKNT